MNDRNSFFETLNGIRTIQKMQTIFHFALKLVYVLSCLSFYFLISILLPNDSIHFDIVIFAVYLYSL